LLLLQLLLLLLLLPLLLLRQEVLYIRKLPVDVHDLWAAVQEQGGHLTVSDPQPVPGTSQCLALGDA